MPSPDTSAQDAPVASQGAVRGVLGGEAVVEIAFANLMERWIPRPQMTRHEWRALFTEVEAAIRASERERYAALLHLCRDMQERTRYSSSADWALLSQLVYEFDDEPWLEEAESM